MYEPKEYIIDSVGYVIRENDVTVRLPHSMSDRDANLGHLDILKRCIVSRKILRKGKS